MSLKPVKTALVCIAKNEDNYIDEWINYYLKLGVDDIFIYQNDWRVSSNESTIPRNIHLIEADGEKMQFKSYEDFIKNRSNGFDFAMFFDCDEFLTLKHSNNIGNFLSKYENVPAVSVNWRVFGDNGRKNVEDGNYLVLKRFTKCGRKLNPRVKQIVNLNVLKDFKFVDQHTISSAKRGYVETVGCDGNIVIGGTNPNVNEELHSAYLNHYYAKTFVEWNEKKGDGIVSEGSSGICGFSMFEDQNVNEVDDTRARRFMYGC